MHYEIVQDIESLCRQIRQALPLNEINNRKHFPVLDKIAISSPFFVIISSMNLSFPFYIGPKSLKFLGITQEDAQQLDLSFFARIVHPEHMHIVHQGVKHFTETPDKHFINTYRVKSANNQWHWLYGCSKAMSIGKQKSTDKIMLTILYDINVLLRYRKKIDTTQPDHADYSTFLTQLSPRELDIFALTVKGWSNEKVGNALGISHTTAQTHKRNIMRKLGAKNTSELILLHQKIETLTGSSYPN